MARARPHTSSEPAPTVEDPCRICDILWERIRPILPPRPGYPLACHNPRVYDRRAIDAIFVVLRTGCQWVALDANSVCSHSSARCRSQGWTAAGVFVTLWAEGLQRYDELKRPDREWLAMDGVNDRGTVRRRKDREEPDRFQAIVGRLQPILSRLPPEYEKVALERPEHREATRQRFLAEVKGLPHSLCPR